MALRRTFVAVVAAVAVFFGGVALASIPSPDGVVNGCYKNNNPSKGALIVIDSTAACPSGYTALNWNQTTPTTTVTSTSGSGAEYQPGDGPLTAAFCPSGQKAIAGGWEYGPPAVFDAFQVVRDKPIVINPPHPSAWSVRLVNTTDLPQVVTIEVYAICTPIGV